MRAFTVPKGAPSFSAIWRLRQPGKKGQINRFALPVLPTFHRSADAFALAFTSWQGVVAAPPRNEAADYRVSSARLLLPDEFVVAASASRSIALCREIITAQVKRLLRPGS